MNKVFIERGILLRIIKRSLFLAALVGIFLLMTSHNSWLVGMGVGVSLSLLNFLILTFTTKIALQFQRPTYVILSYLLRYTIIGTILYLILISKAINFISTIIGLAIITIGILWEGIMMSVTELLQKSKCQMPNKIQMSND